MLRNHMKNIHVNAKVLVEEEEIDFAAVGIGSHGEQRLNLLCHFHTLRGGVHKLASLQQKLII